MLEPQSHTARALLVLTAKVLAFGFAFGLPLLLVRKLSQAEFGYYKQVFLIVTTALTVIPIGFGMSAYYFLPREPDRRGAIVLNILVFYLVIATLTAGIIWLEPTLLARVIGNQKMAADAGLLGLTVWLWMVASFLESVAIADRDLKAASVMIVGVNFTKAVFLLTGALCVGTVRSVIAAAVVHGVLQVVLLLGYLRRRFGRFWLRFEWETFRRQAAYAIPIGLSAMVVAIQTDIHNYFVSFYLGPALFAVYAVGCFQVPLIGIVNESIGSILIPRVSELEHRGEIRAITELLARMLRKQAALYFPLYAFLLVAGRDVIAVLFTSAYLAAWPVFAVYLTLIPLCLAASACDPVMRAFAAHRYFFLAARLAVLVGVIGGLWYATPRYGVVGAVVATVVARCVEWGITGWRVGRILGVTRRDVVLITDIGKIGFAALCASIPPLIMNWLQLDLSHLARLSGNAALFGLSYLTVFWLLRIPTTQEIGILTRGVERLRPTEVIPTAKA